MCPSASSFFTSFLLYREGSVTLMPICNIQHLNFCFVAQRSNVPIVALPPFLKSQGALLVSVFFHNTNSFSLTESYI